MDKQRSEILGEFSEFLESAISKAKVNFLAAERISKKLQGARGAHGGTLRVISKSTLHYQARGKQRQNLPAWSWVANLWAVLVDASVKHMVDPARLGTLREWQDFYEEKEAELRRLDKDATDADEESAVLCPTPLVDPRTTWWASFAGIVPPWFGWFLNLEPLASYIRCYEDLFIPGLLQTAEYAEEVVRLRHGHEAEEQIRQRVRLRMLRQSLQPHQGRVVWSLINERALREPPVDRPVMRRQLLHLLSLPNTMPVQIVPEDVPARQLVDGPITVLRFRHGGLPDTVYLEQQDSALYPDDLETRALYFEKFSELAVAAHRPKRSRDIIERLVTEL